MKDRANNKEYWNRYSQEQMRDMTPYEKAHKMLQDAKGSENMWKATVAIGETMLDTRYPMGDPRRWEKHLPRWRRVLNRVLRAVGFVV